MYMAIRCRDRDCKKQKKNLEAGECECTPFCYAQMQMPALASATMSFFITKKGGVYMNHTFLITGTTLTIHLPAEIDHHNSEEICRNADRIIQSRNIRYIQFDFEDTVFMDSSGIGMLIGRYKMMRFLGGTVIAVHVGERMQRILTMSGIYKVMDIYEGVPQESGH